MYNGTIDFVAEIRGNGLTFPHFEYDPQVQGILKVEIEGFDGNEIRSKVHLTGVQSIAAGIALATDVNTAALNRIVFSENIVIQNARVAGKNFSSLDDKPTTRVLAIDVGEHILIGEDAQLTRGLSADTLRAQLEKSTLPGERFYGLFRSARQSTGPVEEFMHLYNILMVLIGDNQQRIDQYIISQEPSVPQTPSPWHPGSNETLYTRLRNELAHQRTGGDLSQTKAEMIHYLGNLSALARKAIESTAL